MQTNIADVRMESGTPDPPRLSRNGKYRWCLCCDTPLPASRRSPLCEPDHRRHRNLRRERNSRPTYFQFERRYLTEAHDDLDQLDAAVGRLLAAYAAGQEPRGELKRTAARWATFTTTFRNRFPRP
ncbi:hypothetical protein [Modestobacter sp. SYSU DS0875]